MALIFYGDETAMHDALGIERGSEHAGVGGFLSRREDWEIFVEQWSATLAEYGIEVFHYSDIVDGDRSVDGVPRRNDPAWPYFGWNQTKIDAFMERLIGIARDNTLGAFGGFVAVRDYDRLVPQWLKDEIRHPYYFCFQLLIDNLIDALKWEPRRLNVFQAPFDAGEQVAFVFDQQNEFSSSATEMYFHLKGLKDADDRLGTIAFADKRKSVPLQAADLLVARTHRMLPRVIRGEPPITRDGSWDDWLLKFQNHRMTYYDAGILPVAIRGIEELRGIRPAPESGK